MTQDKIVKEKALLRKHFEVHRREFAMKINISNQGTLLTLHSDIYVSTGAFKKQKVIIIL